MRSPGMSTVGLKAMWEQERAEGQEKRILRVTLNLGRSRKRGGASRPRDEGKKEGASQRRRGRESALGDPSVSEPESGQASGSRCQDGPAPQEADEPLGSRTHILNFPSLLLLGRGTSNTSRKRKMICKREESGQYRYVSGIKFQNNKTDSGVCTRAWERQALRV